MYFRGYFLLINSLFVIANRSPPCPRHRRRHPSQGEGELPNCRIMRKTSQEEIHRRAKKLREKMTKAEMILWDILRNRKLKGRKFRRQHPVGSFIVDFYCHEEKMVVELDGDHHITDPVTKDYDERRTAYLQNRGLKVIRFENELVVEHPHYVINEIRRNFV